MLYIIILGMLLAGAITWAILTYPRAGDLLYQRAQHLEAWCYGFKNQQITLSFHSTRGNTSQRTVHFWDNCNKRDNDKRDKPAVILLHGYTADRHIWLRCARYLNKTHRIIIPDLLGHGDTGYQEHDNHSTVHQAALVMTLTEQLGIKQYSIVGNSMGGFIAGQCALQAPDRVSRIVLSNAAGVNQPTPSRSMVLSKQGKNPFFMNSRTDFKRFYSMTMARPPFVPHIILDAKADTYIARKAQLIHIFNDFFNPDDMLDAHLHTFTLPVLILWGAKDEIVDVSAAHVWAQIDNAIQVIWDDLGHLPMVESPKQTALEIRRFLR